MIGADGSNTSSTLSSSLTQSFQSGNYPSSDNIADSLGVMVQVSIKTISARLEMKCGGGVADVFGVGGHGKDSASFASTYKEYTSQITQLDTNICLYLKVLCIVS